MLKVVPDSGDANPTDGGSLLDEIVRDGAVGEHGGDHVADPPPGAY